MRNSRLDELLQEEYVFDAPSKLKYEALSEEQRFNLTKNLIDSCVRVVIDKSKSLDFSLAEASKGSFRKLQGYADIIGSIEAMKAIQSTSRSKIHGLDIVETSVRYLEEKEEIFRKAFAMDCTVIKILYNCVATSVIIGSAYVVSNGIDMVKEGSGLITMTVSPRSAKSADATILKTLEKFNKMCANGDIDRVVRRLLPESQKFVGFAAVTSLFGSVTLFGGIAFAIVAVVVMMRQFVYMYYNMRVKTADYLRVNAEFVEMNQSKLAVLGNMEGTKRKQQEAAKKLIELADKIDIDQKVASKRTAADIKAMPNSIEVDSRMENDDILF